MLVKHVWILHVRDYLAGRLLPPDGEQLELADMPEPPTYVAHRMLPFVMVELATGDGKLQPGRAYLAALTGSSQQTVKKWMRVWVALGWLEREALGHRGRATEYRLTVPTWAERGSPGVSPKPKKGGPLRDPQSARKGVPTEPKGGPLGDPPNYKKQGRAEAAPPGDDHDDLRPSCPSLSADECRRGVMCPVHGTQLRKPAPTTASENTA